MKILCQGMFLTCHRHTGDKPQKHLDLIVTTKSIGLYWCKINILVCISNFDQILISQFIFKPKLLGEGITPNIPYTDWCPCSYPEWLCCKFRCKQVVSCFWFAMKWLPNLFSGGSFDALTSVDQSRWPHSCGNHWYIHCEVHHS